MSDVVRNYNRGGTVRRRRQGLRRHGTGIAKFLIPPLILLSFWVFWATRNNYDRSSFIPENPAVEIYIYDVVAKHSRIAVSNLGELIPESAQARQYWEKLSGELPAPEWLINNLSTDLCHLYGASFERPEEMIITTQMTRIGRIAEWVIRFYTDIEKDAAGGLNLYSVPNFNLYYAVRGRVLIASFSRNQLIRALTLRTEDTVTQERLDENISKARVSDIFLCIPESESEPPLPFTNMEATIHIEPTNTVIAFQGVLAPEFITDYAPFMATVTPQKLPEPFDCMATAGINLGIPFRDIIEQLREVHPVFEGMSDFLKSAPDSEATLSSVADITSLFREALRVTGSKTRIACFGMEPYEMLPMPYLAASFNADTDAVLALFERIEPFSGVVEEVDTTLRLDEDILLAYSPVIGGQAIKPTIASYGGGMLISSSATLARELTKSPQLLQTYSEEGNLYLAAKPYPVTVACVDAARELAFSGLLRGHNETSLNETAQPFLDAASKVDNITLFSSCNRGLIRMNMKLDMAASRDSAEASATESGNANE